MMEHLLAKMDANQAEMKAMQHKMGTNETKADTDRKEIKNIETNQAKMDIHQEKMEATIHSIWPALEETNRHRVEDVLLCVNQKTQGLYKELTI
jgi:predicted nuclease with TOPRIM domain